MTTRRTLTIALALLLAPAVVSAQPTAATTDGDDVVYWNAPVVSGVVTFGAAYGASVVVAGSSDHQGDNHLYVPLAGPWMDLADRGTHCSGPLINCDNQTGAKVLLVADGVFQVAGALSILGGLLSPTHRETHIATAKRGELHIVPTAAQGPGVALVGHF